MSKLVSMIRSAIILFAGSLTLTTTSHALQTELNHIPPTARTALGIVTIEVQAPQAKTVRMLVTGGSQPGIAIYPLTAEQPGIFRSRPRGKDLIGKRYTFQIKSHEGRIEESQEYTVLEDADIAQQDEILAMRHDIDTLDTEIASLRRALTTAREQLRISTLPSDTRSRAAVVLSETQEPSLLIRGMP